MSKTNRTVTTKKPVPAIEENVLKCLSEIALTRSYDAEQHIIYEGDICKAAYFILEGNVQVYRTSPQGRQHILVQLGPGQAFNTVPAFLTDSKNVANAVAVTPATILVVAKNNIDQAIELCPNLAREILHEFATRLSHLSNLAGDLALNPVRARLARFLLDQVSGSQPSNWTHEQIAAHIGSVREVVSRTMRDFVKQGLIHKDRQRLVIADPDTLEREAQG